MTCKTPDEAFAAGYAAGRDDAPLTQQQADLVHALLRPSLAKAA